MTKKREDKKELIKIIKKSIERLPLSILTLLFGPFYLLYKKIYTPAIITLILYIATSIYLSFELNIIIKILINIFLSIKYKDTKKEHIKPYILIIVIIIYLLIVRVINIDRFNNYNKTDNSIDKMSYKIPYNIKEYDSSKNNKYYVLDNKIKGKCFITISSNNSNMYSNPEEYISDSLKFETNYKKSNIKNEKINNITWTKQILKNNKSIKELYVTKYDNTIYEIKFESTNSNNICNKYKKKLLKTIKIKR